MIARFSTALSLPFSLLADEGLPPYELTIGKYFIRVYPPQQGLTAAPIHPLWPNTFTLDELRLRHYATANRVVTDAVRINGRSAYPANLIVIDFIAENFDRSHGSWKSQDPNSGDPPVALALDLANSLIDRIRTVIRAANLKNVGLQSSWYIRYVADDGSELPSEQGSFRARAALQFHWNIAPLSLENWTRVWSMPLNYDPPEWDKLLLDAEALLPDLGASLTVANAALEVFASWANGVLVADSPVPREFWSWVNDRGDWYQNPSVVDRFDPILKALCGQTLKEQTELWEAFKNLRSIRNNFVHDGRLRIGKSPNDITEAEAILLLRRAKQIVEWVEALLPEAVRRPKTVGTMNLELTVKRPSLESE